MEAFLQEILRAGIAMVVLWLWAQGAEKRAAEANDALMRTLQENNLRNVETIKENTKVNVEAVEVNRELLVTMKAMRDESARDHGDMRNYLEPLARAASAGIDTHPRP